MVIRYIFVYVSKLKQPHSFLQVINICVIHDFLNCNLLKLQISNKKFLRNISKEIVFKELYITVNSFNMDQIPKQSNILQINITFLCLIIQ